MKIFTFHIDTTASVEAKNKQEARSIIQNAIENNKEAVNDEAIIIDEIISGSQVGELINWKAIIINLTKNS